MRLTHDRRKLKRKMLVSGANELPGRSCNAFDLGDKREGVLTAERTEGKIIAFEPGINTFLMKFTLKKKELVKKHCTIHTLTTVFSYCPQPANLLNMSPCLKSSIQMQHSL